MKSYQLFALLAAAVLPVALPAQDAGAEEPANVTSSSPPVTYRSPFTDYRPSRDTPVASWRETNETVRRLGGHTGHVRAAPPSPPVPAADPEKPGAAGGHEAHH